MSTLRELHGLHLEEYHDKERFEVMVSHLVFMSFDQIKPNRFRFRVAPRLKSSKGQMLNLQRSHGIHGQHKFIVYGGQMRVKVLLKSNGLSDLSQLTIIADGIQ